MRPDEVKHHTQDADKGILFDWLVQVNRRFDQRPVLTKGTPVSVEQVKVLRRSPPPQADTYMGRSGRGSIYPPGYRSRLSWDLRTQKSLTIIYLRLSEDKVRSGTGSGTIFMTLEDEIGMARVIVSPGVYEENRMVLNEGFVLVYGVVHKQDAGVHLRSAKYEAARD